MSAPSKPEVLLEARKLVGATFVNSIGNDARRSVGLGPGCDSIVPAALLPDGDWVGIDKGQRSDGIGIRRIESFGVQRRVARVFVPWANVADLSYGFDEAK